VIFNAWNKLIEVGDASSMIQVSITGVMHHMLQFLMADDYSHLFHVNALGCIISFDSKNLLG
jgi:hypothetical protein